MIFRNVRIRRFRSIHDSGPLALGQITVLIGPNNSGKSALLRAVMLAQGGVGYDPADVRYGEDAAMIELAMERPYPAPVVSSSGTDLASLPDVALAITASGNVVSTEATWQADNGSASTSVGISSRRPNHVIVPVLSRRKSAQYETTVRRDTAEAVGLDDRGLASRLQALGGDHEEGARYRALMQRVLGVTVSTFLAEDGVTPGVPLSPRAGINLERMGDGVRNVVTLAAELADRHQARLFLIEEPENDLHPEALYALLQVIRESAEQHQFIISTHSDTVLRELGSVSNTVVYQTSMSAHDNLPTTSYSALIDEFDRRDALVSLGYREPLPIAWLAFEESTAESFVTGCLIPMFAPRLAAARTVSADGTGNLPRTVEGLHRMVLFARLAEPNAPRAWVLADGDEAGRDAVRRLRAAYATWPASRFQTFDEDAIESYYPSRFGDQVRAIAAEPDKQARRRMKANLLKHVLSWSVTDGNARRELEISAGHVIDHLKRIEDEIIRLQGAEG